MCISDWSSVLCSSDLVTHLAGFAGQLANTRHNLQALFFGFIRKDRADNENRANRQPRFWRFRARTARAAAIYMALAPFEPFRGFAIRSEAHTSELQSLMRISYAVFCLKIKKTNKLTTTATYY